MQRLCILRYGFDIHLRKSFQQHKEVLVLICSELWGWEWSLASSNKILRRKDKILLKQHGRKAQDLVNKMMMIKWTTE